MGFPPDAEGAWVLPLNPPGSATVAASQDSSAPTRNRAPSRRTQAKRSGAGRETVSAYGGGPARKPRMLCAFFEICFAVSRGRFHATAASHLRVRPEVNRFSIIDPPNPSSSPATRPSYWRESGPSVAGYRRGGPGSPQEYPTGRSRTEGARSLDPPNSRRQGAGGGSGPSASPRLRVLVG